MGTLLPPPLWEYINIDCEWIKSSCGYIWGICTSLFWGSCGHHHCAPFFSNVPVIGALWFLPAYFVGKNVYLTLKLITKNRTWLGIICLILSLSAMAIDNYLVYLPFALNQGLSTLIFFFIGNNFDFEHISINTFICFLVIWILSLFMTEINIAFSALDSYSLLGIFGVVGAFLIMRWIAVNISNTKSLRLLGGVLGYIGINSLYVFSIHYLFMMWVYGNIIGNGYLIIAKIAVVVLPVLVYFTYDLSKRISIRLTNFLSHN